jgi:hypothetical protein
MDYESEGEPADGADGIVFAPATSRPGRKLNGRQLAWYLVGWTALSVALVVAVTIVDRPGHSHKGDSSGGQHRAPMATLPPTTRGPQQLTAGGSVGWTLRVQYTAIESYHHGALVGVTGCLQASCSGGPVVLGSYPNDFVAAVRAQGNGRITTGRHAGRYLNWAPGLGYWLDTAVRDAQGRPLRAFASATSATPLLPLRTRFKILSCGVIGSSRGGVAACARLRAASWTVVQVPNPGPIRSLSLYVGPETSPRTELTFSRAVLRIG